jgi:hypothetical protein
MEPLSRIVFLKSHKGQYDVLDCFTKQLQNALQRAHIECPIVDLTKKAVAK